MPKERKFVIGRTCTKRGFIMDDGHMSLCTDPKCSCEVIRQNLIKKILGDDYNRNYEALILSFIPKLNNNEIKEEYYKHFNITNKRNGEINKIK